MNKRGAGEANGSAASGSRRPVEPPLRRTLRALLSVLILWAAWSIGHIFYSSPAHITVVVGEPSPRDIKAPRTVTYVSQVKTEEARRQAAAEVQEVYTGADMRVASEQLHKLQELTDRITAILQDASLNEEQRLARLQELPSLPVAARNLEDIARLDTESWQNVRSEALRLLDLVMRQEIRSDQLAEAQRYIKQLTPFALPEEQRAIAAALAQSMVVPNSFLDAEATQAKREAAQNAVAPIHRTIREGESILREGEIATALALEALQVLGLLESEIDWQQIVGAMLLMAALVVSLSLYVAKGHSLLLFRPRREFLLLLVLLAVGVSAPLIVPGHTLIPYLFPVPAAAMVVAILVDADLAVIVSAVAAIIVGFDAGGSVELIVYTFIGSLVGALTIWRMEQLGAFVRATVYMALANWAVILGFRLHSHLYDPVGLFQLLISGLLNAILSSSLTFVAFAAIGRLFGIATSLQLLELARPTHPLFRQLLIKAPGTYHHSIIISNMAERAAEAIGADALLARVGSYYHDVGKLERPYFFAENQAEGDNPHDGLDPKTSADIIISHATDGLVLARKYRLPDRVCAFIPEHHGTTLVSYFYRRASQESEGEEIREEDFSYPGPKPQSRETAIVMLADSIEATVRANRPPTQAEMERIIRQVINDRLISGQLDECDLTLKDLDAIREAFISVLQGVFHPRIQYPERIPRRNGQEARVKT